MRGGTNDFSGVVLDPQFTAEAEHRWYAIYVVDVTVS
jgi:hypothetical protein